MLIDAHAHLAAGSEPLGRLLASMNTLNIDQTAVVLGGLVPPRSLGAGTKPFSPDTRCDNLGLLEQCRLSGGRLIPFYFANPWMEPLEYRQIGAFFYGLKLGPAVHGAPLTSSETRAYVHVAKDLAHPVYLHCLDRVGFRVVDLVRLSQDFPEVEFILGHGGIGQLDYDCVDLIAPQANISYETSGAFSAPVKYACTTLGSGRVIFGSEYPLQSAHAEIAKLHDLGLDQESLQAVSGLNFLRLLKSKRGEA